MDPKTSSDNPTSAASAAPSGAAASASPAASVPVVDPKVVAPTAAAPPAADPKAVTPAAPVEPAAPAPDPNAPATGVNADEAKALADAATAKAVTDKAAADALAAADAEAKAAAAAPESYAIDGLAPEAVEFLKKNGGLNPDLLPALTPALKEAGLTQKQFSGITSAFLAFQEKLPQMMLARDMAAVKADPAIGGLNYSRSMEEVSVALDAFADPDFKKWAVQAGVANKLEFVRVFQRIGRAMRAASDSPSIGSPDAAPAETMAQRLYRKKT